MGVKGNFISLEWQPWQGTRQKHKSVLTSFVDDLRSGNGAGNSRDISTAANHDHGDRVNLGLEARTALIRAKQRKEGEGGR
jgi:hypothetical protein